MCCGTEKKVKLALEMADDLPDWEEIDRWLGEPIGCLIIKSKTFLTNSAGFPVLSKAHQKVINQFLLRQIPFVISGSAPEDLKPHFVKYLSHLSRVSGVLCFGYLYCFEFVIEFVIRVKAQIKEDQDIHEDYYKGYEDFLQIPLQPLMDNLDQYTYEIFEKDPVKYLEYRRAIKLALLDKKESAGDSP